MIPCVGVVNPPFSIHLDLFFHIELHFYLKEVSRCK
jgi:hypothetical protein